MSRSTFSGPVVSAGGFISGNEGFLTVTAATLAVTEADHNGKFISLDRAAGVTCTLPAAIGSGAAFTFYVKTTVSSNADIIKVANSTDVMVGWGSIGIAAGGAGFQEAITGTDDTISLNGTTTGGIAGSVVEVTDIAAGFWLVNARLIGSGTLATAYSATV